MSPGTMGGLDSAGGFFLVFIMRLWIDGVGTESSKGSPGLDVQDGPLTWLAVDAGLSVAYQEVLCVARASHSMATGKLVSPKAGNTGVRQVRSCTWNQHSITSAIFYWSR